MTLPPLRTGSCLIAGRRYPAIVGEAKGLTPELFVCGLHIDRFIKTLPPAELRQFLQQGISIQEAAPSSKFAPRKGLKALGMSVGDLRFCSTLSQKGVGFSERLWGAALIQLIISCGPAAATIRRKKMHLPVILSPLLLPTACLIVALPVFAQNTPPKYDEDGCEALAARIDAAEQAKRKPSGDDAEQLDLCISFLGCDKSQAAAKTDKVPADALQSNKAMMHWVNVTCGHLK